jgi:hypothetical protein
MVATLTATAMVTTALITTAMVTTAMVTTALITTVLIAAAPTVAPPIAASSGSHAVAVTPAAVIVTPRLIVARVVTRSAFDAHAGHCAGIQQGHGNGPGSGRHPMLTHDVHFGSTVLSLSVHSISPNGAPAGSATTATCPP